ncbi:MAG TPA: hypothetical protein VJ023_02585 [Pyrinomonadaceae bacterium]|nr:hypothetical protein [Pyrinomonadaceae bacterium]
MIRFHCSETCLITLEGNSSVRANLVDKNTLIGLLFSGGTALAGLILVFLGGVLSGYDSYDAVAKNAVRPRYKRRAKVGLAGFIFAMSSAILAFAANWLPSAFFIPISIAC